MSSERAGTPVQTPAHLYVRDKQSGAGNCTCGAAERHRRHFHEFVAALHRPELCVCALPKDAGCHW